MKKLLALLLALTMCVGLMAGVGVTAYAADDPLTAIDGTLSLGDAVPNFTVTLEDGSVFTLSEALETYKAVMVNLWYTQCVHCCNEMPVIQSAYENYKDDVALVCLSPVDDNEAITAFKAENNLTLPMGYDSVGLDIAVNETMAHPMTIIIDRFGNIAYEENGEIKDAEVLTGMWDYFISDDYTESQALDAIPGAKYEGEYPTDEELSKALSPDGSVTVTYDHDDDTIWPYVVSENGIVNSNALALNTTSAFVITVSAKAGDVFAFDYASDIEVLMEMMTILVNGEMVNPIYYSGELTWTYTFPADGDYEFDFIYVEACSASGTTHKGTIAMSNARLATGTDAEALLASLPQYVYSLEGDEAELEFVNENAKEFKITLPDGEDYSIGGIPWEVVNDDTIKVHVKLGDAWDATQATLAILDGSGNTFYPCAEAEMDEDGYLFEIPAGSYDKEGDPDLALYFYPDPWACNTAVEGTDGSPAAVYVVLADEKNVNTYVKNITDDNDNLIEGVTWEYADGTKPSTDECVTGPNNSEYIYNITIVDEKGEPVNGCMINICDDVNCNPQVLTDTNYYGFNGINDIQYAYVVHVLKVPDGYTFDADTTYTLNASGDALTITVPHA